MEDEGCVSGVNDDLNDTMVKSINIWRYYGVGIRRNPDGFKHGIHNFTKDTEALLGCLVLEWWFTEVLGFVKDILHGAKNVPKDVDPF